MYQDPTLWKLERLSDRLAEPPAGRPEPTADHAEPEQAVTRREQFAGLGVTRE